MTTANNERGEVLIRLGGRVHRLRPTCAALVEVRQETGVPLRTSWLRIQQHDVVEAAIVLGAVLRANGHKLSNEQVGERLLADGITNAVVEISALIEHMLTGGVRPGALGEARAATGTASSPSAAGSGSP